MGTSGLEKPRRERQLSWTSPPAPSTGLLPAQPGQQQPPVQGPPASSQVSRSPWCPRHPLQGGPPPPCLQALRTGVCLAATGRPASVLSTHTAHPGGGLSPGGIRVALVLSGASDCGRGDACERRGGRPDGPEDGAPGRVVAWGTPGSFLLQTRLCPLLGSAGSRGRPPRGGPGRSSSLRNVPAAPGRKAFVEGNVRNSKDGALGPAHTGRRLCLQGWPVLGHVSPGSLRPGVTRVWDTPASCTRQSGAHAARTPRLLRHRCCT